MTVIVLLLGEMLHIDDLWRRLMQRSALRRAALRYAEHGWLIVPGAVLTDDRYACGPLCPTVACHPAVELWERNASSDLAEVAAWWASEPFSVLLATGHVFDVIDVPEPIGAPAARAPTLGPVVVSPTGRWMFLVEPGDTLRRELSVRLDIVLHSAGSWIPAPPTRSPIGRIRWAVHPSFTGWRLPDSYAVQSALVACLRPPGPAASIARPTHARGAA